MAAGVPAHRLTPDARRRLALVVLPLRYPGWQEVPGSSARPDPVQLVSYDARWPRLFRSWQQRLLAALRPALPGVRAAHVGSTAVPNLPAKPIVDIQVSVPDQADEPAYVAAVERLGLELRARDDEHRFLRPPPDRPRDVHVHVCTAGGRWERDHLLFRDFLRADGASAAGYARVKAQLAHRWRDDRFAYTEAKTAIILETLERAEAWAGATGWTVAASKDQ